MLPYQSQLRLPYAHQPPQTGFAPPLQSQQPGPQEHRPPVPAAQSPSHGQGAPLLLFQGLTPSAESPGSLPARAPLPGFSERNNLQPHGDSKAPQFRGLLAADTSWATSPESRGVSRVPPFLNFGTLPENQQRRSLWHPPKDPLAVSEPLSAQAPSSSRPAHVQLRTTPPPPPPPPTPTTPMVSFQKFKPKTLVSRGRPRSLYERKGSPLRPQESATGQLKPRSSRPDADRRVRFEDTLLAPLGPAAGPMEQTTQASEDAPIKPGPISASMVTLDAEPLDFRSIEPVSERILDTGDSGDADRGTTAISSKDRKQEFNLAQYWTLVERRHGRTSAQAETEGTGSNVAMLDTPTADVEPLGSQSDTTDEPGEAPKEVTTSPSQPTEVARDGGKLMVDPTSHIDHVVSHRPGHEQGFDNIGNRRRPSVELDAGWCSHRTIARFYGTGKTCERCGSTGRFGWLWNCCQDVDDFLEATFIQNRFEVSTGSERPLL
jgi:hypothetical protein